MFVYQTIIEMLKYPHGSHVLVFPWFVYQTFQEQKGRRIVELLLRFDPIRLRSEFREAQIGGKGAKEK